MSAMKPDRSVRMIFVNCHNNPALIMKSKYLPFIPLIAFAAFTAGCATSSASSNYDKAAKTSTSLQKTALSVDKGELQIDAALVALSDLVNNPGADIKPQFKKFEAAVEKLDELSKDVRDQAVAMQEKGAAYFQQWDADLATIQSEDIRSRSTDRKNAVAARFDRVRASYAVTRDAFVPFMSRLTDVRTALSTDLTSGGLASVRTVADQAKEDATPLREALRQLSADFKYLGLSLSSSSN